MVPEIIRGYLKTDFLDLYRVKKPDLNKVTNFISMEK